MRTLLANSQQLQSTIPGWENPVTSAFEVNKHISELGEVIDQLIQKVKKTMNRPVPPPPPKEEKKEDKAAAAGATGPAAGPAGEKMDVENAGGSTPNTGAGEKMDVEKTA